MNNTHCPNCHTVNAAGAQFCSRCGTRCDSTVDTQKTIVRHRPCQEMPSDDQLKTHIEEITRHMDPQMTHVLTRRPEQHSMQRELLFPVVDISDSMNWPMDNQCNKLDAAKQAVRAMVIQKSMIDVEDEIGVISFNSSARCNLPLSPLHSHQSEILNSILSLTASGGTKQQLGLKEADRNFQWERQEIVRRIVLLTDGCGGDPVPIAKELKNKGVVIDVIGVGHDHNEVNEAELRQVASVIEGQVSYRFIKDSQTLHQTFTQLGNKTIVR